MGGRRNQQQPNIIDNRAIPDCSLAISLEAIADAIADRVAIRVMERIGNCQPASVQAKLFTVQQAASYIGRTPEAVNHLVSERRIPTVRSDKRIFIDKQDLDKWIDENKRTVI